MGCVCLFMILKTHLLYIHFIDSLWGLKTNLMAVYKNSCDYTERCIEVTATE